MTNEVKNFRRFICFLLLFAAIRGVSFAAEEPPQSTSIPADSKVSFDRAFDHLFSIHVPLILWLPPGYVIRDNGMGFLRGNVWGTPDDLDLALKKRNEMDFSEIKRGVFNVTAASMIDYDRISAKFSGEDTLEEDLKEQGVKNIKVRKADVGGFPIFWVMGQAGERHVYFFHFASNVSNETVTVAYRPPPHWTPLDDEVWNTFVSGFAPDK